MPHFKKKTQVTIHLFEKHLPDRFSGVHCRAGLPGDEGAEASPERRVQPHAHPWGIAGHADRVQRQEGHLPTAPSRGDDRLPGRLIRRLIYISSHPQTNKNKTCLCICFLTVVGLLHVPHFLGLTFDRYSIYIYS